MSTVSSNESTRRFEDLLRPFQSRVRQINLASIVVWGIFFALIVLLSAMWLDLIWSLPTASRWILTRVGGLTLIAAIMTIVWLRNRRLQYENVARLIDEQQRTGGAVLAGWELSSQPVAPNTALSLGLADISVRRTLDRLTDFFPKSVVPVDELYKGCKFLAVLTVGVLGLWFIIPGIANHQLKRFLFPSSDIPPYTGVVLEVTIDPTTVLYGSDAQVITEVLAGSVKQVNLVTRTESGSEVTVPMLKQSDGRFQAMLNRVVEPLDVFAKSGVSRSTTKRLEVQLTPVIEPPQVTIISPEYTKRAVYKGMLPQQGLTGLVGTKVDWLVRSNRPLKHGTVALKYSDGSTELITLNVSPDTEDALIGSMTLKKNGEFEVSVIDIDNIASQNNVTGTIQLLQDGRPVIRIIQPKPMSFATTEVDLPIVIYAEDDYGIASVSLFRSLNGSPATAVNLPVDGSPRQQISTSLALPKYGLSEGDEIRLFARAEDNDPTGTKGSETPVTVIQIISAETFKKAALQREGLESMQAKYKAAARYLENLANALKEVEAASKALEESPESEKAKAELQGKMQAAAQKASEAQEALEKLKDQAMPVDVDQALAEEISKNAELARQARELMAKAGKSEAKDGSPSSSQPAGSKPFSEDEQQSLQELIDELREKSKEVRDSAVEPMQAMQKALPLIMAQQRFITLANQQRNLAERIESLQTKEQPSAEDLRRAAELESEQQEVRRALDQLLDDIAANANEIPEDDPELNELRSTALEFVDAVKESVASTEMSNAQDKLLRDEFAQASGHASEAARALESFIGKCNSMGNAGGKGCKAKFQPKIGEGFGNSIQQLMGMLGMKPGSSVGGSPGSSFGWGAGGGYASRFNGPENVGMYGAMPMNAPSEQQGRGDTQSSGSISESLRSNDSGQGSNYTPEVNHGNSGGQGIDSLPAEYRSRVADYYQVISEALGQTESETTGAE